MITDTDASDGFATILAEVPLGQMFGYSTELRSATQVRGIDCFYSANVPSQEVFVLILTHHVDYAVIAVKHFETCVVLGDWALPCGPIPIPMATNHCIAGQGRVYDGVPAA
jgi:hypothetical protein